MKKGFLIAILCFVLGLGQVFSQDFFSTDKATFFEQLSAYLNTSTSKKERDEAAAMMKGFADVWNTYYSGSEAATAIRLCETFHAKSALKAYSNIFNFTEVLYRMPSSMSYSDVSNWLAYTDMKAQKSMNGMDKYLSSCRAIFAEKVLSAKGNSKWTMRDARLGFPSKTEFNLTVSGHLALVSAKDESVIKQTQGVYHLEDNRWEGSGGRADWSRFGISEEKAFVILPQHYTLDLNRSEYAIDSVIFNDKQYFQEDILGRFEDKVLLNAANEKTMFPRVKSYRSDYKIHDILKNVYFEGGIGMMGNQIDVFGGV